ncbi:MAG: hypothetical protein IH624_13930 [Phycisphaerae bacterium]|nr:hypothetical protein [Phycisphaerae bacterium]
MKTPEKMKPDANLVLDVKLGTAGKHIDARYRSVCKAGGIELDHNHRSVVLDYSAKEIHDQDGGMDLELEDVAPDSFLPAVIPTDREALTEAEIMGLLWSVDANFHREPGAIRENTGAGGNPRHGNTVTWLNKTELERKLGQMMRKLRSHRITDAGRSTCMNVRIIFSAVGGMGSGTMYWFSRYGVRRCAHQDKVDSKIVLSVLLRGNLPVTHPEKARINEALTLMYLRAISTRMYVCPATGTVVRPPDQIYLSSSLNNHGGIATLDELLLHEAECQHRWYHTPAGALCRARMCDMAAGEFDAWQDPLAGCTTSTTDISLDRRRILTFCTYEATSLLIGQIVADGDPENALKASTRLIRTAGLVENENDSTLTGRILHPEGIGHGNIEVAAKARVTDQTEGLHNWRLAEALLEAVDGVRSNDILTNDEPLMRDEAKRLYAGAERAFDDFIDHALKGPGRLDEAYRTCSQVKTAVEDSQEALSTKINYLQDLSVPHEQTLGEAQEQVEQTHGFFRRLLNHPLARRLASSIEESGKILISYDLQQLACRIAEQEVLTPLINHIVKQQNWLTSTFHELHEVVNTCQGLAEQTADRAISRSLGLPLVNRSYLEQFWADHIDAAGGRTKFARTLCELFLRDHKTFAVLTQQSGQEGNDLLQAFCMGLFRPKVDKLEVLAEFLRLYPGEQNVKRVLQQLVNQSEGRVLTEGEVDRSIVWLKAANVPSVEYVAWAKTILEQIDRKAGKWEVAVNPDPERFTLIQMRSQISVTPLIKRLGFRDTPADWKLLIEHAVDPFSAIGVGPRPNQRQVKRVFAKGIAAGLIREENGGAYLTLSGGESALLGSKPDAVLQALRANFRWLVYIESTFGHELVVHEEKLLAALQDMATTVAAENGSEHFYALVDSKAIEECVTQCGLLIPRSRRIKYALDHGVFPDDLEQIA